MYLLILNILFALLPGNKSFENELDNYLKQHFSEYSKYSFNIEEDLSKYESIEINYDRSSNRIGDKFFVPVKMTYSFGVEKDRFLQVEVKIFEKVLVAVQPIERGDLLNSTNTNWKEKDITNIRQEPIKESSSLGSIISKYDLQPGDIICYDFTENSPVLNPGDPVSLFYTKGTVVINFSGVSRQAGAVGDVVKVRANGKQYSAKVINSKEALIIEQR